MPDVTGKDVLIVGDSLSASSVAPGAVLGQNLAGANSVTINAKVGRSARSFYGSEGGAQQIQTALAAAPDVVIVVLGTNDIVVGPDADVGYMQQLHDDLASQGADVWAFGPPAFAAGHRLEGGEPGIVSMMQDIFGDHFIDLRPLSTDLVSPSLRTADGIHFVASSGQALGQRMAQTFQSQGNTMGLGWALLAAGVAAWFLFR